VLCVCESLGNVVKGLLCLFLLATVYYTGSMTLHSDSSASMQGHAMPKDHVSVLLPRQGYILRSSRYKGPCDNLQVTGYRNGKQQG
jgi:hypothetical protein